MTVYAVRNRINGKTYIGKTVGNYRQRWNRHCYSARQGLGWHLQCSIRKYGRQNFELLILADNVASRSELNEIEKRFIRELRTTDPTRGYNMTEGGDDGSHTTESREKIRRALIGNKNGIGNQNSLGYRHSRETRKRMSEVQRATPNAGRFRKGCSTSVATQFKPGQAPWNKGLEWSPSVRRKMKAAWEKYSPEQRTARIKLTWLRRKASR